MNKIDLHIHTCASDGTWTAEEVVKEVKQKKYQCICYNGSRYH